MSAELGSQASDFDDLPGTLENHSSVAGFFPYGTDAAMSEEVEVVLPLPERTGPVRSKDLEAAVDRLEPSTTAPNVEPPSLFDEILSDKKRQIIQDQPNSKKPKLEASLVLWQSTLHSYKDQSLSSESIAKQFIQHLRLVPTPEVEDIMTVFALLDATERGALRFFCAEGGLGLLKSWASSLPSVRAIVALLHSLSRMPVTVDILKKSGIGKTVHALEKHSNKIVAETASKLIQRWREIAQPSKSKGPSPQLGKRQVPSADSVFAAAIVGPKKAAPKAVPPVRSLAGEPPPEYKLVIEEPQRKMVPIVSEAKSRPVTVAEIQRKKELEQLRRSQEAPTTPQPPPKKKKKVHWAEPSKLVAYRFIPKLKKGTVGADRASEVEAQLEHAQLQEARREKALEERLGAMSATVPWRAPVPLVVAPSERLVPLQISTEVEALSSRVQSTLPALYVHVDLIPDTPGEALDEAVLVDEALPNILWGQEPPPLGHVQAPLVVSGDVSEVFARLLTKLQAVVAPRSTHEPSHAPSHPPSHAPHPPSHAPSPAPTYSHLPPNPASYSHAPSHLSQVPPHPPPRAPPPHSPLFQPHAFASTPIALPPDWSMDYRSYPPYGTPGASGSGPGSGPGPGPGSGSGSGPSPGTAYGTHAMSSSYRTGPPDYDGRPYNAPRRGRGRR